MSFVAEAHEHLALRELNAALVALVDRMLLAFDTAEHVRLWEDRRRQAALRRAAGVGRKGPPHPPPPSRGAATDGPAAVALPHTDILDSDRQRRRVTPKPSLTENSSAAPPGRQRERPPQEVVHQEP